VGRGRRLMCPDWSSGASRHLAVAAICTAVSWSAMACGAGAPGAPSRPPSPVRASDAVACTADEGCALVSAGRDDWCNIDAEVTAVPAAEAAAEQARLDALPPTSVRRCPRGLPDGPGALRQRSVRGRVGLRCLFGRRGLRSRGAWTLLRSSRERLRRSCSRALRPRHLRLERSNRRRGAHHLTRRSVRRGPLRRGRGLRER
jgi:hypothetical protein